MSPRISVAIPTHDMENGEFFLNRLLDSLEKQTFRDFEIVITNEGKMAENSNAAIKQCMGEIVKILYMDDYLMPDALQHLNDTFTGGWYASGCIHTQNGKTFFNSHYPSYNPDIRAGNNTIGSPSVIAFENSDPLLFDENLSWLLDCDLYGRLYERYGEPTLNESIDVVIGVGPHQMTNILSDTEKQAEFTYLKEKLYGTTD